jgi:hypothetical protein
MPELPSVALSGLALIQAISSLRLLAGMELRETIRNGCVAISPTGASGSNLTLESRMGFPSDLPNVVVGFQAAISRFVAEANDDPKPFTWLADPNKSIVAVRRGYQVLDSIH